MKLSDFLPIVRSIESTRGDASRAIGAAPAGARPARTVPETFTPAFRSARSSAAAARVAERPLGLRASVSADSGGHSSPRNPDFQPGASRRASHSVSSPTMLPVTRRTPDGPHGAREPRDVAGRERRVAAADEVQRAVDGAGARRLADGGDGGVHARRGAQLARGAATAVTSFSFEAGTRGPRSLELVDRRAVEAHDGDRDGRRSGRSPR